MNRGWLKCICGTRFFPSTPRTKYCSRCSGNYARIMSFTRNYKCIGCQRPFDKNLKHYARNRCSSCYKKYLWRKNPERRYKSKLAKERFGKAHPDFDKEYYKKYSLENPEYISEYKKQWWIKKMLNQ